MTLSRLPISTSFITIMILILGGSIAAVSPSRATILADWSLEDFVVQADAVVCATVTAIDVRWNADHTQIRTDVTLAVDRQVAGAATLPAPLVLEEQGGRVGRTIHQVAGVPVYRLGERVLVFVERVDEIYRTLGFFQGKYTLEIDPDTGRELYVQRMPADGVTVAAPDGLESPAPVVYGRDELIDRVRAIAGIR